jgi:hypothetical protein
LAIGAEKYLVYIAFFEKLELFEKVDVCEIGYTVKLDHTVTT